MSTPFRIAVITTEYSHRSHADVIVSRWVKPVPTDAAHGWANPSTQIASLYVEQIAPSDKSRALSENHGIPIFDSIEGALTLGGDSLAVDAVMLIAEHGTYPLNTLQQKLYPRKEMFDRVINVFRRSGRVVPLFFDKHFSWNPAWAHEMYWTIREMEIPFFGGSSLPYSPLISDQIAPPKVSDGEMVEIYFNEVESYLFHSLEIAEDVKTLNGGAPSSIARITAWHGDGVWDALERGEFSSELLDNAAAAVSEEAAQKFAEFRRERGVPVHAFRLEQEDGFTVTHFMQKDVIRRWSLAWRGESGQIGRGYIDAGTQAEFHPNFARLDRQIEDFFLTGQSPVPLERLYISTMSTAASMMALGQPNIPFSAPWLSLPVSREFRG